MDALTLVGGILSVVLLAYLTLALLAPERLS